MSANLDQVRQRVLQAAKVLLIRQGYQKTTLRQIIRASGVTQGSLYQFLTSKDMVLQAVVSDLTDRVVSTVNRDFADESPEFRYAAILAVEMAAVEHDSMIREIYCETYMKPGTFEFAVNRNTAILKRILSNSDIDAASVKPYIAALLMRVRDYITSFYVHPEGERQHNCRNLIASTLESLGLSKRQCQKVTGKLDSMQDRWRAISSSLLYGDMNDDKAPALP